MNHEKELGELIKRALPPLGQAELRRDLWPQMLRRLEERPRRVPWFDWALAALAVLCGLASPQVLFFVLYHL